MSKKVVVLQKNNGDTAKRKAIQDRLHPLQTIYYSENGPIPDFPANADGELDYLLFTGGHGNFKCGAPTQMNGLNTAAVRRWTASIDTEFGAIILDTCFSSSFIPVFAQHIPMGGAIVCAHGSGEGFTDALVNPDNAGKSVGEALTGVVDGISGLGLGFTSLSLYVRTAGGLKLVTSNGGKQRSDGLTTRSNYGMDSDGEGELSELDAFLFGKLIAVEVVSLDALKIKLIRHLPMRV
jgi:hypothetical protein